MGNLPYNISTPILFHLLGFVDAIEDQHFMLQKEVIDRMVARPATSDYGRLSVMLQWRYAMENVLFVPPEAFDPPPRVDSAVVRMVPLRAARGRGRRSCCRELVQVAFSQRRKLLRHTLGKWLEQRSFAGAFDVQRRAEEVPVDEYLALAQLCARLSRRASRQRTCGNRTSPAPGRASRSSCGLIRSLAAGRASSARDDSRSGRRQPVARVEGAAHAQRQGRHVHQFVGGHLLAVVGGPERCCRGASVP